ncbi:MAG: hypothetical protein O7D91_17525 [Planctomycetota bacterium]|nr:hypothetical protein [Planctomycetota bacterium]
MATRVAATDTVLGEDTYTGGGANAMALAFHAIVPSTTFFSIGMCVSKFNSDTSSVPFFEEPATSTLVMVDRRNTLDYAMCLAVLTFVYGPSDSGETTVQTNNIGT